MTPQSKKPTDRMTINVCEECGEKILEEFCQNCCDHGDMDDGMCLDCGKDRREDLMSAAYDYYKDKMKYGD